MRPVNRRVRWALRTVAGTAVVAVVALGVAYGPRVVPGGPDAAATAGTAAGDAGDAGDAAHRTTRVAAEPGDGVLACPGPARLTDAKTGGDAQFRASPVETVSGLRAAALEAGPSTLAGLDGTALATLGAATLGAARAPAPTVAAATPKGASTLTTEPTAAGASVVGATVASATTSGDLRGLAAAPCTPPATDTWLVGGDTRVGSSTQLVVQNPGKTAATVAVDVYGGSGPVTLADGASLVVPAHGEVVRLLESSAAGQDRLAVHLTATGGAVAAHLQHTMLTGIVPEGVDLVAPAAAPGRHVAVVGVVSRGESVADADAPRLRLLAPDRATTADLTVWGPDGRVWLHGLESVDLDAGAVVDVPLGGLAAGTYTVAVDARAPVVAGAEQRRPAVSGDATPTDSTPWDVAWTPGQALAAADDAAAGTGQALAAADAAAGTGTAPVAVPAGSGAAVVVTAVPADRAADAKASGSVRVRVTVVAADGSVATKDVDVASGSTLVVDPATVTRGEVAAVSVSAPDPGGASVLWGVVLAQGAPTARLSGPASGQLFSVLAPVATRAAAAQVVVRQDPTLGLG